MHNERSIRSAQQTAAAETGRVRGSYIPRACPIAGSEELTAFSDGMLEGSALRQIDGHAAGCSECAAWLHDLQKTRAIVGSVRNAPRQPGEEYWSRLFRASRQSGRPQNFVPPGWRSALQRNVSRGWTVAALSAAVCFAAGVVALIAPVGVHKPLSSAVSVATAMSGNRVPAPLSLRPTSPWTGDLGISVLVESHARMVSDQPLEDHARAAYVVSDLSARATGEAALSPSAELASLQPFPETEHRSAATVD